MLKPETKKLRREARRRFADGMHTESRKAFDAAYGAMIDGKGSEREDMARWMIAERNRYAKRWGFVLKGGKHCDDPEWKGEER